MSQHLDPADVSLVGRSEECAHLDRLVLDVSEGSSRVLVIRGHPGAGKSALMRYLADRLPGWRVLTAAGAESETHMAYSGLHQLCRPLLDGALAELPGPQRDALSAALGLASGPAPDRLLVGLAVLTLLTNAAERDPVMCLVDDAQWIDDASAQVVAFVARRLLVERVGIVCAARSSFVDGPFTGLPVIDVRGLSDSAARTLLLRGLHGPVDATVVDQIVAECRGNPLALLELPLTWRSTDLAGGFAVPSGATTTGRIEESYTHRLASLPVDTQVLMVVAAAEPLGDPVLLSRAARLLDLEMSAAVPAIEEGLADLRGRVRFVHPLARSATYHYAGEVDLRRVHGALAAATDPASDPDRRAWHLALATASPDEAVAAALEESAVRAWARGGLAAAAAFLTRATKLTPRSPARFRRALEAASANVEAGRFDAARELLTIAGEEPSTEAVSARVDLLRAQLALAESRGNDAAGPLLIAAHRLELLDVNRSRETYLDAFTAALFGARLNHAVDVPDVAAAVRAAPRPERTSPAVVDALLDGFMALTESYEPAVPVCREAVRLLLGALGSDQVDIRWFWHGTVLALEVWDERAAYSCSAHHAQSARESGALAQLPLALSAHIPVLVFCGEMTAAEVAVAEAESVEGVTGVSAAPYGALILKAWRGGERDTKSLVSAAVRDASARGEGIGVAISEYAHAVLCNGLGQYEEALGAALGATADSHELVAHNWGLTELVEAAVRSGRADVAADAQRRLGRRAEASGTDWAVGVAARSRALLSGGDTAEGLYREAITRLQRTRVRSELARAHLLYGEWLRRVRRRGDARRELNAAREEFNTMGMAAFAERALRELAASGAGVSQPTGGMERELTSQELHIAHLAQQGLSNSEIGSRLFLSARTVEWHLHKVFTKLRISSRAQLSDAL